MDELTLSGHSFRQVVGLGATTLVIAILGSALILSANTPAELRTARVGTCYCHCAGEHVHGGCVKICQMPEHASRPWVTTCAKPRLKIPIENRDAGPRYEHPGRNERARLSTPAAGS